MQKTSRSGLSKRGKVRYSWRNRLRRHAAYILRGKQMQEEADAKAE